MVMTCVDFALPTLTTIPATVTFLFQQIFQEPEVQRKMQAEIDMVVGQGRAPTLDDRAKYIQIIFSIISSILILILILIIVYHILKLVYVK